MTIKIVLFGLDQDLRRGIVSYTETSEHLGLGCISAYVQQRGFDCDTIQYFHGDFSDIFSEREDLVVGFSVLSSNYESSRKLSAQIKQKFPEAIVIWGGHQAMNYPNEVLREGSVDYVIMGEGEKSFCSLVERIRHSGDGKEVEGVAYFDGSVIIKNHVPQRLTSEEIDSIDFRLVHDDSFVGKMYLPHFPYSEMRLMNVMGSRGCYQNCTFCSNKVMWGRKVTFRSPNKILDEVEYLLKEKDTNYVFFTDNDFLTNKNWALSVARGIIERGMDLAYSVMASVHSAYRFNGEEFSVLRESGCREIGVGMESGSLGIREQINKRYENDDLVQVSNMIYGNGINLGIYYMLGYPSQTEADLCSDLALIKAIPFSRIRPVFITPYPGTDFYEYVEKENLWIDGFRNKWAELTGEQPVVKSKTSSEKLVDARKRIFRLYMEPDYKARIQSTNNTPAGKTALKEFLDFINEKGVKNA